MSVDCIIEDKRWAELGVLPLAVNAYAHTLGALGMSPEAFEIGLLACDDEKIAALNDEFRSKGTATNVLSWPSEERGAENDGDVPYPPVMELRGETFWAILRLHMKPANGRQKKVKKTCRIM